MADNNPDNEEARLTNVRRRLNFGDTNDENLSTKNELELKFAEEKSKDMQEKKAKWNFDFKVERPLKGRWEWERVEHPESQAPGNANTNVEHAKRDAQEQAS